MASSLPILLSAHYKLGQFFWSFWSGHFIAQDLFSDVALVIITFHTNFVAQVVSIDQQRHLK